MRRGLHIGLAGIGVSLCIAMQGEALLAQQGTPVGQKASVTVQPQQPLWFEADPGGTASDVKFRSRGHGYELQLSPDRATVLLGKKATATGGALTMRLLGAKAAPSMAGVDPLSAQVYHVDANTRGELVGRPTFGKVRYSSVYSGVDLVYYGSQRQLEFDFIVAPHADPSKIRLSFSGAEMMTLAPTGELILQVSGEEVRLKKPLVYQERGGQRVEVAGRYAVSSVSLSEVAFELAPYDSNLPLVIDPVVQFATYYGGTGNEFAKQLRANAISETYVLANSDDSTHLPNGPLVFPYEVQSPSFPDCVISKRSSDGGTLLYSVVFQGAGCQAMDLGEPGKVHFAVGSGTHHLRTLTEQSPGGLSVDLLQGAYDFTLGPVGLMRADGDGNVYLLVQRVDAATQTHGVHELQKVNYLGQLVGAFDVLTPVFTPGPDGIPTTWELPTGMDVDENGHAYIVGRGRANGPIVPTANAFQPTRLSAADQTYGFLVRVDTNTANAFQIDYATYVGGSNNDYAAAVAVDRATGEVYVAGTTSSFDFPVTPGTYAPYSGSNSSGTAFIMKLKLDELPASQISFSTVLYNSYSGVESLVVLPGGLPAIAGMARDIGLSFPEFDTLYPARSQNETRPFVSVFSANASTLLLSTFLSSTQGALSFSPLLASSGSQFLYIATSTDEGLLATAGSAQPTHAGEFDVLLHSVDLSRVLPPNSPPDVELLPAVVDIQATSPLGGGFPLICDRLVHCFVSDPDGDALTDFTWYGPNGLQLSHAGSPGATEVFLTPGSHEFRLVVRDSRGAIGYGTFTVNVSDNTLVGDQQTVTLTDELFVNNNYKFFGNEHPAQVTFEHVTVAGITWLRRSRHDLNPAPPGGMQAGSPPYYYDIQTVATTSGTATVCINIEGMSFANPSGISLYRLIGSSWNPMGNQEVSASQICGDMSYSGASFGTFAIFYPEVVETTIATIAGNGIAESSVDGPGGDPSDDFADLVAPTQSTLTRPSQMAFDPLNRLAYVVELGTAAIRRINLASSTISTVLYGGQGLGTGAIALDSSRQYLYHIHKDFDPLLGGDVVKRLDLNSLVDTVVAGGGACCSMPLDGEQATAGHFLNIEGLAVDPSGNLFLVGNSAVLRVDATGRLDWILLETGHAFPGVHSTTFRDSPLTLAFDSEGHLLVGGQVLVRVSPGADGLVDGSADEAFGPVGGIPGDNMAGYSSPFAGDGLNANQAALFFSYQMIVAADGAVIFTDGITHRIRRIDPGPDGVVNGGPFEIVQTIAGFFSTTAGVPSPFATSLSGDWRGLAEDPLTGQILATSHSYNRLLSFGVSPLLSSTLRSPDLTATKWIDNNGALVNSLAVNNGDVVRFLLVALNQGNGTASGPITLTDTLDPGLGFVAGSDPRCGARGQVVTCVVDGPFAPNQEKTVYVFARVGAAVALPVQITNRFFVVSPGDSNIVNDVSGQVELIVNALPPPNLTAYKDFVVSSSIVGALTVQNGATVRYRIRAINVGVGSTTGAITIRDTLAAGLTFVAAASDPRCVAPGPGQQVTCTWAGPLAPTRVEPFDIVVQVSANLVPPGQSVGVNNFATVSTPGDSDEFDDDSFPVILTVNGPLQPNLTADKYFVVSGSTLSTLTVHNGATVRYRIRAINNGVGSTTGSITVADTLAAGLTFVAASSDQRCVGIGQQVTCTWSGPLAANTAESFDVGVHVNANITIGQVVQINNIASVSTSGDSDGTDDGSNLLTLTVDAPDATPPVVTAPASIVVAAILPTGTHGNEPTLPDSVAVANFVNGGSATDDADPAPFPLTPLFVNCADPSIVLGSHAQVTTSTLFPIGQSCVRFSYQDASGNVGTAGASVTVNPPVGGAVVGTGVPATATDSNNVPQPVTLTFLGAAGPGLVQANPIVPPPAAPAGFQIVGTAYDLTTTVQFTGSIRVCFSGGFVAGDVIYHNGVPVVPTTVSGGVACAFVTSLSPFMVARPVTVVNNPPTFVPPTNIITAATSAAGAEVSFTAAGNDAEDGTIPAACAPASGASFPITTTTVSCAVTDSHGLTASGSFTVTVTPLPVAPISLRGGAFFIHDGYQEKMQLEVGVSSNGVITGGNSLKYYYTRTRMNLASTQILTAVVTGHTATLTGLATVNGAAGFTFTLTVSDGSPDAFGITVRRADGSVYYSYSQAVSGGDLIIH